jgi:uncharacterized membrane protein
VFLIPGLLLLLTLFTVSLPLVPRLRESVLPFGRHLKRVAVTSGLLLLYVFFLTLIWNLGVTMSIQRMLAPAFAFYFFLLGTIIEQAQLSWLQNGNTLTAGHGVGAWHPAHQLGGKLLKAGAAVTLLGAVSAQLAFFFIILPVIFLAFYSFAYSYLQQAYASRMQRQVSPP